MSIILARVVIKNKYEEQELNEYYSGSRWGPGTFAKFYATVYENGMYTVEYDSYGGLTWEEFKIKHAEEFI